MKKVLSLILFFNILINTILTNAPIVNAENTKIYLNDIVLSMIGKKYRDVKEKIGKSSEQIWWEGPLFRFGDHLLYGFKNITDYDASEPFDNAICDNCMCTIDELISGFGDRTYAVQELSDLLNVDIISLGYSDYNDGYVYSFEYSNLDVYLVAKDDKGISKTNIFDVTVHLNEERQPKAEKEITVFYNNKKIDFDQPPILENGHTLVPVRAVFKEIGIDVLWDDDTSTVTATGNGNTISMRINDIKAFVNGKPYFTDVPAKVIGGRTMVPVRFIAESLDAFVEWNAEDKIVNISDRVHFFIKFNNVNFTNLLSNDYAFDKWYQYYLNSIQSNKAKWASASILKFWNNPFTYWSETDTKKIATAVLIDALTNDTAVENIEKTANDYFIKSLTEDIVELSKYLSDKETDYIGNSVKDVDAELIKLQDAMNYIYSHKDLSGLSPNELKKRNEHIINYEYEVIKEMASESYNKLRLEKLDTMLKKTGVVCDVASLVNAGVCEYSTIKALIYTKNYYTEGLDLIYNNLSDSVQDKVLKNAIKEVKATMNQSMIESIQQCVNSVGTEFLQTSIAETIAKEFVVKSLKVGAEKFMVKIGVNATKAASITTGIGNAANVVGTAVTAGQVTTAVCDVVLSTDSGVDASYDLRILMDIEQRVSGMLSSYLLDLTNNKNTINEVVATSNVLKAIRMQASLLTNVIYNSDHNSLVDKGFRLVFTDKNVYDDTYDNLYKSEIDRIKNINFINY